LGFGAIPSGCAALNETCLEVDLTRYPLLHHMVVQSPADQPRNPPVSQADWRHRFHLSINELITGEIRWYGNA